jgi:hypothetical protein
MSPRPASVWHLRLLWAACAGLAFAILATARALTPDPSGFGTHTQLGLPPCGFLRLTALPCPLCGLTTAFAHMARLQITSALHAHVLGPALFALTVLALPLCLFAFARALPIARAIDLLRLSRLVAIIGVAVALCWAGRVAVLLWT